MSAFHLTHSRIDTGTATLHVEDSGDGMPALVFLHYWGGSSRTWHPVIERLSTSARCVAIDHRGWGQSSAPATGYAIGDLADDARAAITALGLNEYILVGHSMGGKVTQLLATQRPDGLRGLVLVAPAPAKPEPIPDAVRAQMAEAYTSRDTIIAALDTVLRHAVLSDELREQIVADSLAGAAEAKHGWPAHAIVEDVSAELGRINVPVLVVAGEHDRVEPVDVMRSHVVAQISGAQLDVIRGSGHLIPLERPQELSDRIADFRDTVTQR
jgi:pimeloyl-ACP methyl ester carboxylesterase